ncbi:hypothetical protein D9C73_013878 [Collichthys lucidus]|uniref:Uncharacterized protein n=1 Tax=Collichthys lucidus TaxID=240159 RepID=A0A4U5UYK8_COLLU|nr:hypothetical protein D9C73_013878 [Collichthys lucidus]
MVFQETMAIKDLQEIQALEDHLVTMADLEKRDQEVILVLLESKGPLVTQETLDTSQARLVRLDQKVFLDDLASKASKDSVDLAQLASQVLLATKETKEEQDCQVQMAELETQATRVLQGYQAGVLQVLLTVS